MTILAFAESSIQLVPDGTLLLHLLIVVAMVAILNRTLFRPINKVLAEREEQTSGRLNHAQQLRAELESNLLRYERGLREARSAAYHLVEIERTQALRQREDKLTLVREEIRLSIAQERAEIERQAQEARKTLAVEAIQSAIQIGSQILHRPVKDTGDSRLGL